MEFEDKTINCVDCATPFVHSAADQARYAERGLGHEPKRCPTCRAKRGGQGGGGGGGGGSSGSGRRGGGSGGAAGAQRGHEDKGKDQGESLFHFLSSIISFSLYLRFRIYLRSPER